MSMILDSSPAYKKKKLKMDKNTSREIDVFSLLKHCFYARPKKK
jgi:hypothetical protein